MYIRFSFLAIVLFLTSCKKYKDPAPITDGRLTTKYCNDPAAVNYNWDFPGVPDNTVCIYPTDIFKGTYLYHDSILNPEGGVIQIDSFPITINQLDSTHMQLIGFCGINPHSAKASRFFSFIIDSIAGNGQIFCNNKDTIAGGGHKSGIADTSTIKFSYTLQTDTGVVIHAGTAIKQ